LFMLIVMVMESRAVKALQEWDDLSSSDQFLNYL
jgi:hypothetical protein